AGGIVGRLFARRELDFLVVPDILVTRAEKGLGAAAPVGDLAQQVPLLGSLLRFGYREAYAFRLGFGVALRPLVAQRAGHLPAAEGRDVAQVRRSEGAFRRKVAVR